MLILTPNLRHDPHPEHRHADVLHLDLEQTDGASCTREIDYTTSKVTSAGAQAYISAISAGQSEVVL